MSTSYISLLCHWYDGHDTWNTALNPHIYEFCEAYIEWMKKQIEAPEDRNGIWRSMLVYVYEFDFNLPAKYLMIVPIPDFPRKRTLSFSDQIKPLFDTNTIVVHI